MIDMLVLGALDTLKQGQRSRVMGIKDLWENSEDKSKAWQNERMSFWKGNEKSYLLFCPDCMFFVGKVVAEGKSKKKEESTVFSSCFLFILFHRTGFRSVSPHWEQLCISNPYKPHRAHVALMCSGEMEGLYFYIQPNRGLMRRPGGAWDDKLSSQSASSGEAALLSQVFQVENMKMLRSVYLWRISGLANGRQPFPPRTVLRSCHSPNTKRKEDSQEQVDNCGLWTSLAGPPEGWFSLVRYIISQ